MSIKVIDETVNSITSRRVVLFSQGIMRTMAIGSNWTKIRIGAIISTVGTDPIAGTPRLFFGLLQGTTGGVLSNTTTNFLGLRTSDTEWTANPLHDIRNVEYIHKTGGTTTVIRSNSSSIVVASTDSPDDYSNCIMIDFEKTSSTTLNAKIFAQATTGLKKHVIVDQLIDACNTDANPVFDGYTYGILSWTDSGTHGTNVDIYDSIEIATSFLREVQIDAVAYGRLA